MFNAMLFDVPVDWFWLIIFIIAFLLEVSSPELVSIWFAAGALGALLAAALNAPIWAQFIIFFVIAIISLLTIGRWIKKKLMANQQKTNADSLVGKDIVIIKDADYLNLGEGRINGVVWSITCAEGVNLKNGEVAIIDDIIGNRLVVKHKK